MGYPLSLDEFSDGELTNEIQRRLQANAAGLCSYCGRERGCSPGCRMIERHRADELSLIRQVERRLENVSRLLKLQSEQIGGDDEVM